MSPTHPYTSLQHHPLSHPHLQPHHARDSSHNSNNSDDDSATEVESLISSASTKPTWLPSSHSHARLEPHAEHYTLRSRRRHGCMRMFSALRWPVVVVLQLAILGLLVSEHGGLKGVGWRGKSRSRDEIGGDVTGWGPHLPTKLTRFAINQTFAPYNTSNFFRPETTRAWNELMPIGMGFQSIPDPSEYTNLPTPIVWPNATVYTTSMTHQLHCLYAVIAVYSGLTSNHSLEEDHHWHMIHCFDYMRQAILCSADMALEGLETTFPDHNGGSDGWDSTHVCRDPRAVRGWLEGVRAYDDQTIV